MDKPRAVSVIPAVHGGEPAEDGIDAQLRTSEGEQNQERDADAKANTQGGEVITLRRSYPGDFLRVFKDLSHIADFSG
jgi:hypothetical protein